MTHEVKHASGGRPSRKQVSYGGKPERGLFERRTDDGKTRYDVCVKVDGKVVRRKLDADTLTDAVRTGRSKIAELESGSRIVGRSDVSLLALRNEWEAWARSSGSPYAPR